MARLQKRKQAAVTTGSAETSRPSLRDGFNAYTWSPRGPALLPPSPACSSLRKLGISTGMPGPHDFAVHAGCTRRAQPIVSITARLYVSW